MGVRLTRLSGQIPGLSAGVGRPYTGFAENAAMKVESSGRTTRRRVLQIGAATAAAVALPRLAQAAHMVRPWPAGKPAPALLLSDLDGKAWSLAELKGHPVLLNFWASWCEPCRAEMPSLELLATRHEKAGLVVLSVNFKEPPPTIRRFLEVLPFSLPILLDRDGEVAAAWTPRVFPTTVLIDRNGTPRQSVIGELDWMDAVAKELVEPLLALPKTA
jgi:thiol-disulfide isomerase/thioredoxin